MHPEYTRFKIFNGRRGNYLNGARYSRKFFLYNELDFIWSSVRFTESKSVSSKRLSNFKYKTDTVFNFCFQYNCFHIFDDFSPPREKI